MAYSSQEPWIQNETVRNNILFHNELDNSNYQQVLGNCCLEPDLNLLPGSDLTEIGEKGINLSGGQKARISLARAIYSNKDILLLDGPLSAVDSDVGNLLFKNCIQKELLENGKTILLVTHHLQYLPFADNIIILKNGTIQTQGTYQELLKNNFNFKELILKNNNLLNTTNLNGSENNHQNNSDDQLVQNNQLNDVILEKQMGIKLEINNSGRNNDSTSDINNRSITKISEGNKLQDQLKRAQLIKEEERESGSVDTKYYYYYIKVFGNFLFFCLFFMYICYTCISIGLDFWLTIWTDGNIIKNKSDQYFIKIYFSIGIASVIGTAVTCYIMAKGSISASKNLYDKLLNRIFKAPIAFFNITPIGRILNRFNKDINEIDLNIADSLEETINSIISVLAVIITIAIITPLFIIPMVVILFCYYKLMIYFRNSSREIKRLQSNSSSPIVSNFSETLNGLTIIRSFNSQKHFFEKTLIRINKLMLTQYSKLLIDIWLDLRLEILGAFVVFFASFFAVILKGTLSPALIGLCITQSLEITWTSDWLVKSVSRFERKMNAIERVVEYSNIQIEGADKINNQTPPKDWPKNGEIEFRNIQMKYRPELDLVLKNISLTIKPQEKIGLIGRTGSGKSSLMLCLFRIVELFKGKILIDGIDISKISLFDLRNRLSIIPQDPILFEGSIRQNLINSESSDKDDLIWDALKSCQLKKKVKNLKNQLDFQFTEGGDNFSVGEKQLFCLARAILKKNKILILDEATSNIDSSTDKILQQTIKKLFNDCTILTIAHRINTIMDSDRIICVEDGEIADFSNPEKLLQNKHGMLSKFLKESQHQK